MIDPPAAVHVGDIPQREERYDIRTATTYAHFIVDITLDHANYCPWVVGQQ